MRTVQAEISVPGAIADVEQRWYATERWPEWVDGLEEIRELSGDWPRAGASVRWCSVPTGRGEVTERVVEYTPRRGQALEVSDDSIEGLQRVSFLPGGDGVAITLSLAYRVSRRSPLTPLLELLFVSRAFRTSLETTLHRFAAELTAHD